MDSEFEKAFGTRPDIHVKACGRINIIGEHVDYCGGPVFPAAIDLGCHVFGRPNGTGKIRIALHGLDGVRELDMDDLDAARDTMYVNYQAGVAGTLMKHGKRLAGCDLFYRCDVPFGSGLSSSAAIEVATGVMLCEISGEKYDLKEIALIGQEAENTYCGMNCGIMDQFASALGRKDCAILLDCSTLEYEYVPVKLGNESLIIANSNKRHTLTDGDYNERRREAEEAQNILRKETGIKCLADLTVSEFGKISHFLPERIRGRAEHVVYECDRVYRAVDALKRNDIKTLGELLNASHGSLSTLYEVTGPELDLLAHAAQGHGACLGSRMTGGGFGGCTISVVEKGAEDDFIRDVGAQYSAGTGLTADFYKANLSDGVTVEKL